MPSPSEYENEADFVSACISARQHENPDEETEQSAAACYAVWREKGAKPVIRKTNETSSFSGGEFILSDATIDRYGDSVNPDGWVLDNFKKNPIALFNHNPDFPVGRWKGLGVRGGGLRGHLELAPKGTSQRIDEIRSLVEAGILQAVSVGFMPLEHKPRDGAQQTPGPFGLMGGGNNYIRQELVETSLVSVPANPNALAVAKSLRVSKSTLDMVFAKQGAQGSGATARGSNGKPAETPPVKRTMTMVPISKRIEDAEQRIVKLRDELETHSKTVDDENATDESLALVQELTKKIEKQQNTLDAFRAVEAKLGDSVAKANGEAKGTAMTVHNARPFAYPAKKVTALDHLWRGIAVTIKHQEDKKRNILDVLRENYGENDNSECTRQVMSTFVTKAASIPADTTTTGWAKELVQTVIGDFIAALMPLSVYPKLAAKGSSFTFGRNGVISLPARNSTASLGGSFVAQGNPIPVRQGAFTAITLNPKKMGVITTLTREITEHSTPSIEGIVRQAILEDTALVLDGVLLDTVVATAIRPSGLRCLTGYVGAVTVSPTAGGGIAALVGDLKAMTASLITATKGNIRSPVWIMNPGDALAAQLTQAAAGGDFPFMEDIAAGNLMGYPIIQSTTIAPDLMILMDAADFMTATGDTPRFDVSDQAVLHMDDSPAPLSAVATPNTVAAPTRSLWQTDTMGIRMIMDVNWEMRRTGMVHTLSTMTWN